MALYEDFEDQWEVHREQFEAVLPDVLEDEGDGLTPVEIKKRVDAHSWFGSELDAFYKSDYLLMASDENMVRYWRDPHRLIAPKYENRPELDEYDRPKE